MKFGGLQNKKNYKLYTSKKYFKNFQLFTTDR